MILGKITGSTYLKELAISQGLIDAETGAIIRNTTAKQANASATTAIASGEVLLTGEKVAQMVAIEGVTYSELEQLKAQLALNAAEGQGIVTTKALTQADIQQAVASLKVSDASKQQMLSLLGVNSVQEESLTLFGKVSSVIKSHPLIIAAIATAAIGAGVAYANWYNSEKQVIKRQSELRDELKNNINTINEESKEFTENANKLEDLNKRYNSARKYSDEYYDIANQIAELCPELVVGYTNEGKAIIANTEAIKEQIDAYKKLAQEKNNAAQADIKELIDTSAKDYNEYKSKKDDTDTKADIQEYRNRISEYKTLMRENPQSEDYSIWKENLITAEINLEALLEDQKYYAEQMNKAKSDIQKGYIDWLTSNGSEDITDTETNLRTFLMDYASDLMLDTNEFESLYKKLGNSNVAKKAIDSFFSLKSEDVNYAEYKQRAEEIYDKLVNSLNIDSVDEKASLKFALGIDQASLANFKYKIQNVAKEAKQELSLDAAILKVEGSDNTVGIKDELELVQQALADTKNVGIDTYNSLIGASKDYSSALKVEAGRIVVDNKRLQQIAKNRTRNVKLEVKEASTLKKLEWIKEARRLQQYNFQQNDLTMAIWDSCDALQMEINQFDVLTQGIDSATNAFTEFQNAQNMANTGDYFDIGLDMADAYQKALETGKIGTEEFMAVMKGSMSEEVFSNIINLGDTQAQMNALDKFYDNFISKYLIRGEDEEYDVSGIQNFMRDVAAIVDEEGNHLFATYEDGIFSLVDGMDFESLAEHFGANVEMIYALFGEIEEYSIGDSFTFTDTDAINGYYQRLSELTSAQDAYNEAVENGSKYDQILAKKQLQEATQKYNDYLDITVEKVNNLHEAWLKSSESGNFADYLSQNMSESDMLATYYVLSDKITETQKEADILRKKLAHAPEGSDAWNQYIKQLEETNNELEELGETRSYLEEQDSVIEYLTKHTEGLKDKAKQYLECMEILNNKDKKYGQDELNEAANKAIELIATLGEIPESVRIEFESNLQELRAQAEETKTIISQMQARKATINNGTAQTAIDSAITSQQNKLDGINAEIQTIETVLNMDTSEAEAKIAELQAQNVDKDGTVSYSADFSAVTGAKPPELEGTVKYKAEFEDATPPSKSGGSGVNKVNGTAHALGTAHVTGTAYSNGDWRVGQTEGKSLVGELGTETLVRNGRYYTIGENGAELIDLQPNDIIFNHKQTEQLFKNGYITSRGKIVGSSYAEGSAFNYYGSGSINFAKSSKYDKRIYNSTRSTHGVSDVGDGADDLKDIFEELFDWIEIRIERLARNAEKWANRAETAISNSFFNKYYEKESKAILAQMNANSTALDYYIATANAVGLDEKYAKKVRKGEINIETIKDEKLKEKIDLFQQWYEKALDCSNSFEELATALYNIPIDKATSKIEKFNQAIDLLEKKLDNAIGATAKNKLVNQETKNQKKIYEASKTAAKEAKKNLKSAGKSMTSSSVLKSSDVSKKEKNKIKDAVKNGKEINLSYFTEGSKAYKAAVKYNEALKANTQAQYDLSTATEDWVAWQREAAKIKFDNVKTDYENAIKVIQNGFTDIDNKIKEISATGASVNKNYYISQQQINQQEKKKLEQELVALNKRLEGIEKGTEEWYDAIDAIQEVENNISDCTQKQYELNDAINALNEEHLNRVANAISRIIEEQEFLQGLFAHEKYVDADTAQYTDAGYAALTSSATAYYAAKNNSIKASSKVDDLQYMLDNGLYNGTNYKGHIYDSEKELRDALIEAIKEEQSAIQTEYSWKEKLADITKQQLQAEIDLTKELIDAKKEALNAEKELHDYQNSINEKTKSISTIQKQIVAYRGNSSEEGLAKLQQLQKELAAKEQDLRETEYDKYISDQTEMLDKLYTEYEELMLKRMDDFEANVITSLENADTSIKDGNAYLQNIAENYGYEIQNKLNEENSINNNVATIVSTLSNIEKSISGLVLSKAEQEAKAKAEQEEIERKKQEELKRQQEEELRRKQIEEAKKQAQLQDLQNRKNQIQTKYDSELATLEKQLATATKKKQKKKVKELQQIIADTKAKYQTEIAQIDNEIANVSSGNSSTTTSSGGSNTPKVNEVGLTVTSSTTTKDLKETAQDYVNKHASKAKKKKSEYSDVNQKIYEKFNKKILSSNELKELAKLLGIKYDNAKKTGNLYKTLKSIKFPGFRRGGVISVDDVEKQIKANGDSVLLSGNKGERILTPVQNELFEKFTNNLPQLNAATELMTNIASVNKNLPMIESMRHIGNNVEYGDINFNFELPNVTNSEEFIKAIQTDKKLQKAIQSVSVDKLNGSSGRLSVNRIR